MGNSKIDKTEFERNLDIAKSDQNLDPEMKTNGKKLKKGQRNSNFPKLVKNTG